uniref:Uncharacterized protein n=1 Tax=Candidatus Kentrum sp. LFY TaxID=2126342 RepID=A0A450UL34_9GAMM|nr:MAG: hypothetical protein BECKLFY1418B_GA0070995_104312 [Candidatus Kentron sp. LFY]
MPSSSCLRQRFYEDTRELTPIMDDTCVDIHKEYRCSDNALPREYIPLNVDVFSMDNSGTKN